MQVIKKINNNVALGKDGKGREAVIMGKGIGFPQMPYEITDLSKIDRTYYDVDDRYYGLLQDISEDIFILVSNLVEEAKSKIRGNLNPNITFIIADHINFAIERYHKNMNISLPYSYDLEYEYPEITAVSKWFMDEINRSQKIHLGKGEITSITMHFVNALSETAGKEMVDVDRIEKVITDITEIVENDLNIIIDKNSFDYSRFKKHIQYFVQRKVREEEISDCNVDLYEHLEVEYPQSFQCAKLVDDYVLENFSSRCSRDELVYLMIHINKLYQRGL